MEQKYIDIIHIEHCTYDASDFKCLEHNTKTNYPLCVSYTYLSTQHLLFAHQNQHSREKNAKKQRGCDVKQPHKHGLPADTCVLT